MSETTKTANASTETANEFRISREFDVPREKLFQAWTNPEQLSKWMSPKGFSTIAATGEFKPGGTYHYGLRGPNDMEMWGKWNIREINAPERLVWVNSFSDEQGGLTRHPFSATWPLEMLSTITMKGNNGKTTLELRWIPINASQEEIDTFNAAHDGMNQGWSGTMEQLDAFLAEK